MKAAITPNYIYNPVAKTIDLSDIENFDIKKLYAIVNLDKKVYIYILGKQGLSYSNLENNILTLQSNTSGHSADDNLFILYDVEAGGSNVTIDNFPTGFNINNFPEIQEIMGNVDINNIPSDYNLEATQQEIKGLLETIRDNSSDLDSPLSGIKTTLDSIKAKTDNLTSSPALEAGGHLASLDSKDFATQTTLASIKLKTDNLDASLSSLKTVLDSIKAKTDNLTSSPALESGGNLATIAGKDFATQTTLALIKSTLDNVKVKTDNLDTTLSTLNTSINTHLKPADTLTKVSTVDTITNTVVIKADTAGNQANALKIDGSAVTQPISLRKLYIPNLGSNYDLATDVSDSGSYALPYVGLSGRSTVRSITPSSFTASSGTRGPIQGYGTSGVNISFCITCTALSGGSSPYVDLILCESLDGGTTFKDIYHIERITATNTSNPIHLTNIPVTGVLYFRWVTGGTPSTANITIQYSMGSASVAKKVRYFDRTSGLLAGTLNATSNIYNISTATQINARINCSALSGGAGATYQLQISDNKVDFMNIGNTFTAIQGIAGTTIANIVAQYVRVICTSGATGTQTGTELTITGQE